MELCTFCTETKESLVHISWESNHVLNFWLAFSNLQWVIFLCSEKDIILDPQLMVSKPSSLSNK